MIWVRAIIESFSISEICLVEVAHMREKSIAVIGGHSALAARTRSTTGAASPTASAEALY
jgi:hypothetical protein